MGETTIEWTDKVWNPVTGCTKVSQGCKNCYAERIFKRPYPDREFTDVQVHKWRLYDPGTWRKPSRIFVNSMSDMFHEQVPFEFIEKIFEVIRECTRHDFQILTKRPERAVEYWKWRQEVYLGGPHRRMKWPDNAWMGVSVEDQETADKRISILMKIPANVLWVSYEPALGPVDFEQYIWPGCVSTKEEHNEHHDGGMWCDERNVNWIVCGGESGPHARPMHPDWARSVRDQCQGAAVPFFFKQWGEWGTFEHCHSERADGTFKEIFVERGETLEGMIKVGKKRAGRLLDGREWNEFPEAK